MARIRSLKPDFWQDEKMAPLTPIHRLVFLGLISQADDAGRLVDNVRLIDGLLFPQTEDSSRDSLDTLARLKRIVRYSGPSGQRLIQVVRWKDHQKVDNPSSRVFPPPPPELVAAAMDGQPSGETREDIARPSRVEVGSGIGDVGDGKVEVGPSTHPAAVAAFVEELPDDQNSQHWLSIIDGWRNGLGFEGGKAASEEDIATGLTEYLATAKRDFAVIHVRSFVERARRNRLKGAQRNGNGKESAIELAAGQQLEEIQKLKVRTQTTLGIKFHIPKESLDGLPPAVQSAIAALGGSLTSGAQRILDTPGDKYGILLSQFTKLYAGALNTERARIGAHA